MSEPIETPEPVHAPVASPDPATAPGNGTDAADARATEAPGTRSTPKPLEWRSPLAALAASVGVATGATLLAAVLAVVTIVPALAGAEEPTGIAETLAVGFGDVVAAVMTSAAFVLGGAARFELGGAGLGGQGTGELAALPFTMSLAIAAVTAWWSHRSERRSPSAGVAVRLSVAVGTGMFTAGVVLLLAAVAPVRSETSGAVLLVSGAHWRNALIGAVIIAAAACAGRLIAAAAPSVGIVAGLRRGFDRWPVFAREVSLTILVGAVFFAPVAVVVLIVNAVQSDSLGSLPLGVLYLANLVFAVFALASLGSVVASADFSALGAAQLERAIVWAGEVADGWGLLLPVFGLIAAFLIAVRVGVHRPARPGIEWRRVWQLPVAVLGLWIVVAWLVVAISASGSGSILFFSGTFVASLALTWWTPLLITAWAAVVSIGAELLPRMIGAVSPAALSLLAGRAAAAQWASAGADVAAQPDSAGTDDGVHPVGGSAERAAAPTVAPVDPRTRRRLILGGAIAGGTLLVIVTAVVAIGLVNASRSAEAAVDRYVSLLAAGDADAATRLVEPDVPSDQRDLLTDDVLASAVHRIEGARTALRSQEGDIATIDVAYRLDGIEHVAALRVERLPNELLVLESWRVIDPLIEQVEVYAGSVDRVTVGGTDVLLADGSATGPLALYPGVYEVGLPENEYFEADPVTAVAASSSVDAFGAGVVELAVTPTSHLLKQLNERYNATLNECVASTSGSPDGCPFSTFAADDSAVTWKVVEYPTIEVTGNGAFSVKGGEVSYEYTSEFFGNEYTYDGTQSLWGYGSARLEDGELVVELD